MSKNIIMQQKTASGYEELYPKTNTQEIISSNTTINQFLGGGNSLEDALGYLAGLNQHWWLKKVKRMFMDQLKQHYQNNIFMYRLGVVTLQFQVKKEVRFLLIRKLAH